MDPQTRNQDIAEGPHRQPQRLSTKSMALIFLLSFLCTNLMANSSMQGAYLPKLQGSQQVSSNHSQNIVYVQQQQQELPTCQELMRQPHSPYSNGAFLTRATTNVAWKMRPDGSRELTLPSTCQLKRYTSQEAKQCLAGKKLLFVGDSLTRYTYTSLAYFLEHNKWPNPFGRDRTCKIQKLSNHDCSKLEPNVLVPEDWLWELGDWNSSWEMILTTLGGGTDGGIFGGKMEVTYVKEMDGGGGYEYVTSNSSDGVTLRLAMELGWKGNEPYTGYDFSGCAKKGACRYTSEMYQQRVKNTEQFRSMDPLDLKANQLFGFDWRYDNFTQAFSNGTEFLKNHVDTDYVLYNRGLWGQLPKGRAKQIMESMYQITGGKSKPDGRCFYRTTTECERSTKRSLGDHERKDVYEVTNAANCEFFDVNHITKEFGLFQWSHPPPDRNLMDERQTVLWDAVHYQPWVYEELNNLLLNVLCNAKDRNDKYLKALEEKKQLCNAIDHPIAKMTCQRKAEADAKFLFGR